MMGVAKVSRHHHRAAQPLLEEAGVESAWRDAMNIVDVLHDKTPEHNCRCVQPPDMHAMNLLLHDMMKRISADIGKTSAEIRTKDERDDADAPQCAETCKEVLRRFEEQWEKAGHGKAEVIMPLGFCDLGH